jgi:23S rRNA pseudouridine1911/1915/1917 synthase
MKEPVVIFEDENILVADKPSGLAVHGEGSDPAGTLVEWFLSREPAASGVGEPRTQTDGEVIERSGVVHRLDRETSGVILLAKTQAAFDHFKAEFKARRVKKEYRALVYGKMNERWGTISRKIGRSVSDWRRRSAERGARGMLRDAVTDWHCLQTGEYEGEPFSSLKLEPQTGRTHQLRVHLKAISRPIVGDRLYAGSKPENSNNLGLDRLALHALSLSVVMLEGEAKTFNSYLPEDMAMAETLIAPT